jgi:hypothetical protein
LQVSEHLGHNINVERYCTWGPYVVKLLRHGLRLKDSAVRVSSGDVGWPLGAALAEASKLPDMMEVAAAAGTARTAGRSRKEQARWAGSVAAPAAQQGRSSSSRGDDTPNQQEDGSNVAATSGLSVAHAGQAEPAAAAAAAGDAITDDGSGHVGAWQYSQRRSWAQVLWGSSRRGVHMGHVFAVFVCVVIWLSVVAYCLPTRVGAVGLSVLPVPLTTVLRGLQGPGKAHYVLPVAAHPAAHHGRSRPMSSPVPGRTSGKFAAV